MVGRKERRVLEERFVKHTKEQVRRAQVQQHPLQRRVFHQPEAAKRRLRRAEEVATVHLGEQQVEQPQQHQGTLLRAWKM